MVFNFLKGQFIDVIEWLDDSRDTLVYRFERYGNNIMMGAKLTVREGQGLGHRGVGGDGVHRILLHGHRRRHVGLRCVPALPDA